MIFSRSRCFIGWLMAVLVALNACKNGPGTWKNEEIPSGIAGDFHNMNQTLLAGLKANNAKLFEDIMSRTMLQDVNINRTVELCSIRMQSGQNSLLDEFYVVHQYKRPNVIKANHHGANNYSLNYQPGTKEMYFAFYLLKNGTDKWLLTAYYNKLDYGWKLTELELNPHAIQGKTAPELYEVAKQKYAKGYLMDVVNTLNLSRSCALPSTIWRYAKEPEIDEFYSKVITEAEAAYKFPLIVKQLPTQPKIFRVFNQPMDEGMFPMIYYVSKLNLKDTAALKKENMQLRKVIGQVMPGIDSDKKYLQYTAFDNYPGGSKKSVMHYGLIDTLQ
ncbi:hypothetical protein ABDD95_03530 [Mucilaginibacter sp. PAMB04274]|uniref:hypothetical protein n=1 Tax=Mucilaginibacter sp. PAMB04274 TaxID=3138568 RepID=UPI0031F6CE36